MRRFLSNCKHALIDIKNNFLLSLFIALAFAMTLTLMLRVDIQIDDFKKTFVSSRNNNTGFTYFTDGDAIKLEENPSLKKFIDEDKQGISIIESYESPWVIIVGDPEYLQTINFEYTLGDKFDKPEGKEKYGMDFRIMLNDEDFSKYANEQGLEEIKSEALQSEDELGTIVFNNNTRLIGHFPEQQYLNSKEWLLMQNKNLAFVSYEDFTQYGGSLLNYFYSGLQLHGLSHSQIADLSNTLSKDYGVLDIHPIDASDVNRELNEKARDNLKMLIFFVIYLIFFYISFISISMNIIKSNFKSYGVNMLVGARREDILSRIGIYLLFILIIPCLYGSGIYFIIANAGPVGGLTNYRPLMPLSVTIISIILILLIAEPDLKNEKIIDNLYSE